MGTSRTVRIVTFKSIEEWKAYRPELTDNKGAEQKDHTSQIDLVRAIAQARETRTPFRLYMIVSGRTPHAIQFPDQAAEYLAPLTV